MVLIKPLQHANMRQPERTASFEYQANLRRPSWACSREFAKSKSSKSTAARRCRAA